MGPGAVTSFMFHRIRLQRHEPTVADSVIQTEQALLHQGQSE